MGIQLGYAYTTSPLCPRDEGSALEDDPTSYTPSSVPGARAPHVWLDEGRSTLDWYGQGFVLVQTGGEDDLSAPLLAAARRQGVPCRLEHCDDDAVARAYERRLVLVRPDGHVAWRSDDGLDDRGAQALIDVVRGVPAHRERDARPLRAREEAR